VTAPLPVPEPAQVLAVKRALVGHINDARRALKRTTNGANASADYAAAMAEAGACQSWLDTYVKDATV
jgi:hypothetical protein